MSEYWKSTVCFAVCIPYQILTNALQPKYWCKHCKTFVKDTKLEKTNHEATPKHQGNLQRFLRQLHHGHEREEREKQRAKDEVDRLNGVVLGPKAASTGIRKTAIPQPSSSNRQATPADRKKQLQQLAEMGIVVPEDFRREMAMAGDWQTTSERAIYDSSPKRESIKQEDGGDSKGVALSLGVRKRKYGGETGEGEGEAGEEAAEGGERVVRQGWGSATRTYPGTISDDDNLDTLLQKSRQVKQKGEAMFNLNSTEAGSDAARSNGEKLKLEEARSTSDLPPVGKEESTAIPAITEAIPAQTVEEAHKIKQEDTSAELGIVFKKRRSKTTRRK